MMDKSENLIEIPVTYKGQELSFPAQIFMTGYTYKIQVEVADQLIMFEPDEEGNYRAMLDITQLNNNTWMDVPLLQSIAAVLESALK